VGAGASLPGRTGSGHEASVTSAPTELVARLTPRSLETTVSVAPLSRAVDLTLEASIVLSFSRIGYEVRSRLGGWSPVEDLAGAGRTVVVTGANSGLGYATARALLRAGAAVRAVVRSDAKGASTVASLIREVGGDPDVTYVTADLADLDSVHAVADRLLADEPHLDGLVHNAGAMFSERAETDDGFERTYQVHVLGPHLLTTLLLPRLAASRPARVVTVTSGGMYAEKLDVRRLESPGDYRPSVAYARAKRAQVALTGQWAKRFGGHGVGFHVVHPGWALTPGVETSLPGFRKVMGPILRDTDQGADSVVWLTLADDVGPGGQLWLDRQVRSPYKLPWTLPERGEAERLWTRVCRDADVIPAVTAEVVR
jgi:dehydrogenase/reductase SDR family member 12